MFEVTGTDQQVAWTDGMLPSVELIRPGLWSIPLPIPNNPLRYVLCYCFETHLGPVLVDPGWPSASGREILAARLKETGHTPQDVHGVLLTHAHLDHHGLAGWLREVSGCWVAMHRVEAEMLASFMDVERVRTKDAEWMRYCGVPLDEVDAMVAGMDELRGVAALEPDRFLTDGDDAGVPDWRIKTLWTPGHTPGHLCFVVEGNS